MFHRKPIHHITLGSFGPPFIRIPVRLPVADVTNHVHITGTTNSGKSRLLAQIALSLIERGEGVTMLDPHGDAARLVMGHLVARGVYRDERAYERITYLDLPAAARVWRYTPFNILNQPFDTPTTARLVLEALRRAWPALDNGVAPA
ncbi:MAG: helicase HerA domain-containing protein, partial [Thermomicrobiales bacterium]